MKRYILVYYFFRLFIHLSVPQSSQILRGRKRKKIFDIRSSILSRCLFRSQLMKLIHRFRSLRLTLEDSFLWFLPSLL